jgi:hypothetical protein
MAIFKKKGCRNPLQAAEAPAFIYYDDRFFSVFNQHGYAGNPVADLYVPVQAKKQ